MSSRRARPRRFIVLQWCVVHRPWRQYAHTFDSGFYRIVFDRERDEVRITPRSVRSVRRERGPVRAAFWSISRDRFDGGRVKRQYVEDSYPRLPPREETNAT